MNPFKGWVGGASFPSVAMSENRSGWLYDSIVGYLKSPEWSVPVMEFIDKHCIVFDTEEENKFEFTTIHQEFCEMVNSLLEGFLADMGITPEEFVIVCQDPNSAALNEFVFNQILAVDDFVSFKKMMVKRTLELNVQAMSMLAMEQDTPAAAPAPVAAADAPPSPMAGDDGMDPDLAEAIRLSKETFNQSSEGTDGDDEELKRALAMSMSDSSVQVARAEQEEAELAHAVAMSQAIEEQRLKAVYEEEEWQEAEAIAASKAEAEAQERCASEPDSQTARELGIYAASFSSVASLVAHACMLRVRTTSSCTQGGRVC